MDLFKRVAELKALHYRKATKIMEPLDCGYSEVVRSEETGLVLLFTLSILGKRFELYNGTNEFSSLVIVSYMGTMFSWCIESECWLGSMGLSLDIEIALILEEKTRTAGQILKFNNGRKPVNELDFTRLAVV